MVVSTTPGPGTFEEDAFEPKKKLGPLKSLKDVLKAHQRTPRGRGILNVNGPGGRRLTCMNSFSKSQYTDSLTIRR